MWLNGASSGDDYDAVFEERDAAGEDVHGEASFVQRFAPRSVLDAGCGTGRVARELARRGVDVVGVDRDPDMLATARRKAPHLDWRLDDLRAVDLGRAFDVVLLAGNVMIFLEPGSEGDGVSAGLCHHTRPLRRAGRRRGATFSRTLRYLGGRSVGAGRRLRGLRASAWRLMYY